MILALSLILTLRLARRWGRGWTKWVVTAGAFCFQPFVTLKFISSGITCWKLWVSNGFEMNLLDSNVPPCPSLHLFVVSPFSVVVVQSGMGAAWSWTIMASIAARVNRAFDVPMMWCSSSEIFGFWWCLMKRHKTLAWWSLDEHLLQ